MWAGRPRRGQGAPIVGGASPPRTLASRRDHRRGPHTPRHAPGGAQAKEKSEPPTPNPQGTASQRTGRPLMTRHARFGLVSHSSHRSHPPGHHRRPGPHPPTPNPKHPPKSGGALPRPARVWPMRLSAGGACWESLPASPLIGRGWTGGPCAHCGGRLRGALCAAPPMGRAEHAAWRPERPARATCRPPPAGGRAARTIME